MHTRSQQATKIFGLQLMLDGYGASNAKLANMHLLYSLLDVLPGRIGMHKIGCPHIVRIHEGANAGLSGFIFIKESHISIHTFSKKGFLTLDVYSCKEFDPASIIAHITDAYELTAKDMRLVRRGRRFPVGIGGKKPKGGRR